MDKVATLLTALLLLPTTAVLGGPGVVRAEAETHVLVIGTIHAGHFKDPNYSFGHLLQIIGTYNPDVICVEIRPADFRKQPYLTEMMAASIYGLKRGKKVYPVDWWDEKSNVRAERQALLEKAEFKEKEKLEQSLVGKDPIMQDFEKKYGDLEKISKQNTSGYDFYNGEEFNTYVAEMYKISMQVYGDSPINLFYLTRNRKMLGLIKNAIAENQGRRVIVLTGAEHKHFFDAALADESGVQVVKFQEILPLRPVAMDSEIDEFLKTNRASYYYDTSTPEGVDLLYHGMLISLVHGPDMDAFPEKIPMQNLDKAGPVLEEWQAKSAGSVFLQFELGWYSFLKGSYQKAIEHYDRVVPKLDEVTASYQSFVKQVLFRNIGLCYDLLGQRARAIEYYRKGEELIDKLGFPPAFKKYLFRDFIEKPYQRAKS